MYTYIYIYIFLLPLALLHYHFSIKNQMVFAHLLMLHHFFGTILPNTVRSAPTYLSFRKSLKTYFFNQAFPTKTVFPVLI